MEETKIHEQKLGPAKKKYRVLLTGDRGFIAQRVARHLREAGHDVIGYDVADGKDIMDLGPLELAVRGCDAVMHLAAQADLTLMSPSVEAGRRGVHLNVLGTDNVAYLCAKHGKWLIYASTVCVYGNVAEHPEREDSTLPSPSELYSCSKYAAEWLVRGYGLNYGMRWTSLRFATVYGEGMRPNLATSVFLRQAMAGQPLTVHGDGLQVRTQTYVGDLADGCLAALEHEEKAVGHVFNLTGNEGISALRQAQDARSVTGSASEIVHVPQRANQTIHEDFDTSKAKKLLGWEAKTAWEDGLKISYEWLKSTQ